MGKELESLKDDLKKARQFINVQAEIIGLQARTVSLLEERLALLDAKNLLPCIRIKSSAPQKDSVKPKDPKTKNGNLISFPSGEGGAQ